MTARLLGRAAFLTAALSFALSSPTYAGEVEKAEHRRLSEDMEKKAQKNIWAGVERSFQELLALQKSGEVLTYEDWLLGAQAARGLGDMASCKDRLTQALTVEANAESQAWLDEINANYVPVTLKSPNKEATATLTIEAMLFATDQRLAVEVAQKTLAETREFSGLLPVGNYTFTDGTLTKSFSVASGGAPINVKLVAEGGEKGSGGGGLTWAGPRIDVGGAYTLGLSPSAEGTTAPGAFSAVGARAGVGVELGLSQNFGVALTVGYHNLINPLGEDEVVTDKAGGVTAHLGYGQLSAVLRMSDLWITAGGVFATGVATVQSPTDVTIQPEECQSADGIEANPWCVYFTENAQAGGTMSGRLTAPGASLSVGYALFDLGDGLQGAVSVGGGALASGVRLYPWGQVALTIAPAPKRNK
ncbi:MAG: hypothetical protein RIT28_3066 [Pseudomonadota bacterium]